MVSCASFLRRFLINQDARSISTLFQENSIYLLNKESVVSSTYDWIAKLPGNCFHHTLILYYPLKGAICFDEVVLLYTDSWECWQLNFPHVMKFL